MPWKPDYIDAATAAAFLRIDDNDDDEQLAVWCTAASRAIDNRCNRQFGILADPAARTCRRRPVFNAEIGLWVLEIDDLQDPAGFLVNGVAYAGSGAVLLPDNAPADGEPWIRLGFTSCPALSPNVFTGRWGWLAVPSQVLAAARLQVARFHKRRDSPYGIAGSPSEGSEMRLLARLDPDVAVSLTGLARRRRVG